MNYCESLTRLFGSLLFVFIFDEMFITKCFQSLISFKYLHNLTLKYFFIIAVLRSLSTNACLSFLRTCLVILSVFLV